MKHSIEVRPFRTVDQHLANIKDESKVSLSEFNSLRNQVERLTVFVMAQQATIDEMARRETQHLRDADLEAVKRGEKPGFDNIVLWTDKK